MYFKDNIIFYYSVISLVIIGLVTAAAGIWIGSQSRNYLIETHLEIYPLLIEHMADENLQVLDYFLSNTESKMPDRVQEHMDMILKLDPITQVNLWNPRNQILWSYPPASDLDETQFDKPFDSSLGGNIQYKQFSYKGTELIRTLVPVINENIVIGTVEIIESNQKLIIRIKRLVWTIRFIIIFAGVILYILLFTLFFRAYRHQKRITEKVKQTEYVTIYTLAYQAGLRDEETGSHLKRAAEYVRIIAEELARTKIHKKIISKSYIEDLVKAAPLHDIGKVGIEDSILRKPGKLTEAEFEKIKKHCELGAEILETALAETPFMTFLDVAIQLVRHHHERWDGKGYPHGLAGEAIPIAARIMALSDVYDALRSKRHYKDSIPHKESVDIIIQGSGSQFDPKIVDAFIKNEKLFLETSERMAD